MIRIRWQPLTEDYHHASTRIRALQPLAWLQHHADQLRWSSRDEPADIAVHFKSLPQRDPAIPIHILDLSDNHFDIPGPKGDRFRRELTYADVVVCATEPLASVVREYCSALVVVIPDTLDPIGADVVRARPPHYGRLLWFGNWGSRHHPVGGMRDLLLPELQSALDDWWGHLVVCSNNRTVFADIAIELPLPTCYAEWSPTTITALLRTAELVIIPVSDTSYLRCKSHTRATTAIQAGVPIIASHHPAYESLGVCVDDWELALANPPPTRPKDILTPYELHCIGRRWLDILTSVSPK